MRTSSSSSARSLALLGAVLALMAAVTGAQPATQARERAVFVSAIDADGRPVTGLDAGAFIVREDGQPREILRVREAAEPIDLVLLVDNSTAASTALPVIRQALTAFVGMMADDTRVTLVGLADRPTVLVAAPQDSPRVTEAIERLFALPQSGMTLLDAIYETTLGVAGRASRRAVLVAVLTDGPEFTTRYARDIVRQLQEAHVPLHAVTIGRFDLADEHGYRERGFLLDDGARASGGQWVRLLTHHALPETLQRLGRELTSQYEVIYGRPPRLIPPERIEVESARPGVRMRATPARDTGA